MCVPVSSCQAQSVCPLNSKNDTEGPGANSRDITLVRTGGRGSWEVGEGERVGGWGRERERVIEHNI